MLSTAVASRAGVLRLGYIGHMSDGEFTVQLMPRTLGRCMFCGGLDLTKGHVWPDWLNRILPKTATHHEQETGKFNTFEASVPGPEHSVRIGQGHARTRKPR